jgi:hypothetical protein
MLPATPDPVEGEDRLSTSSRKDIAPEPTLLLDAPDPMFGAEPYLART